MSIKESLYKIKGSLRGISDETRYRLFTVLLIVLVSTASFGLGRLSANSVPSKGIKIITPDGTASVFQALQSEDAGGEEEERADLSNVHVPDIGGEVVASKTGTKYFLPWCGGAKQIAEKNKVTFASAIEAEKAGYTPAANCKGL